jgi:uncharacterized protein YhaN
MPSSEDSERLERAVLLSRHVGDVEGALDDTRRELQELDLLGQAEIAALGPFEGTLGELCSLPMPAEETVARFERAFVEADEQTRQVAEESARYRRRAAELSREMTAEQQTGPVPSEEDLDQARRARDADFEVLCKTVSEQDTQGPSLFEASRLREYRSLVSAADTIADRLRREASRVAESARRRAELEQISGERRRLAELEARLDCDRQRLERDWASSWQVAGIPPVRPAEMRAWLGRRQRAVALAVKQTALARREDSLQTQACELREALGESGRDGPLAVAVARAQDLLDRQRLLAAERHALRDRIAELEVRAVVARRELETSEQESRQSEADLSHAIGELGFDASLAPEEVEGRLEALADLVRARDQSADLERRIGGMRRDIELFEADVAELVRTHAGDLSSLPAWRAAGELVERFERARRDADSLAHLTEEIEERRSELEEHRVLLGRAEREARDLLTVARVQSLGELLTIEARTRQARELRAELDGLDATLGEAAGGRGLEALLDEAAGTDPARLSARLDELDGAIEQLEERHSDSIRSHQRVQAGLELFADTSAVLAAEEERALAASVVVRAEQWARLRLAEVLLAREIERYRQQHQGPILRRASELFVRLTHGEFSGLRVGREERSLVVVRQTDLEVTVDGLNEAARYHLYLALRLASLERYLEHAEPLPLVLDDMLIHFDEDGAHAALQVLRELSARVQVLLFTHHRHNLELAEAAVPSGSLFLHEL